MNTSITAIAAIVLAGLFAQYATAETIPDWIRNNALWWSEGSITQTDFVSGLEFLIQKNILQVPATQTSENITDQIPDWVKNNAAWWAEGKVTDTEFVNSVQYLIKIGLITVQSSDSTSNVSMEKSAKGDASLEAELQACQEITKAYDRLKCEDAIELKIKIAEYKVNSKIYQVGPITFYYPGAEVETMSSGQANLNIQILAENTGSNDNVVLMCTGPSVCNYDVWNGEKAFKYSSTDFTSGQIALKPGVAKEISIFFGPNIGYGGTTFEYDSTKDYYFRISEPWGSAEIPLELK
ncbi:MAG TPA: peptidase [Nitrosopumilaceae archaeon]|nr:peptidase [Nitrosopumilaceae archaeon]